MKLHVHTFTWICGLVGCQPSSVAINFLDHVTKWAPHAEGRQERDSHGASEWGLVVLP